MQDYTTEQESCRSAVTINPAKICQPIGAVYAFLGIHGCLPLSHGSQGCCSYLRMVLSRHYREPIMVTTSSFNEGTAVFGGKANLRTAVLNSAEMYKPDVIGISTTCVAETIGDDVPGIVDEIRTSGIVDAGIPVLVANTPSYVGSHITGYANAVKAIIKGLAKPRTEDTSKVNIIPGFIEPADIREIKRLAAVMGADVTVLPDTTGVVDSAMTDEYKMYPAGGTPVEDIREAGNAAATLALGPLASTEGAKALTSLADVPSRILTTPIGIGNTDAFVMALAETAGVEIPPELDEERGRVVDMITDAHPHFHGKTVALFGDPDILAGLTGLLLEMGMYPKYVLSGTNSDQFVREIKSLTETRGVDTEAISPGDLFTLHQKIKNDPVDLIIGNSYGKLIALTEDIPLIRVGFPITDRANLHHFPIAGYAGAARLVERIGNTLLDRKDRDNSEAELELIQ